ncbi:hypothetical protein ACOME3_004673 [Neoechinorhynchus agilis]
MFSFERIFLTVFYLHQIVFTFYILIQRKARPIVLLLYTILPVQILLNWIDASAEIKPAELKSPRSHECKICKVNIQKRSHHCFFIGRCIGQDNQAAFIKMMFWVSIGIAFASWEQITFLIDADIFILNIYSNIIWLFVWFRWILGEVTFMVALANSSITVSLLLWVFTVVMASLQLFLVWRDQTQFEWQNGIPGPLSNKPILARLRSVFGDRLLRGITLPYCTFRTRE